MYFQQAFKILISFFFLSVTNPFGKVHEPIELQLTWNRRDSTPLSAAPQGPKGDQGWIFGLKNPYLVFQSRVRTEFLYLSLIGIILRWGFLIWELIFLFIADSLIGIRS